jgi:hypothetical protein
MPMTLKLERRAMFPSALFDSISIPKKSGRDEDLALPESHCRKILAAGFLPQDPCREVPAAAALFQISIAVF